MPLLERSVVSQREEFCRLARAPGANVSALCRRFEVGRTAAYRWLKRLETQGVSGLVDRSRRPLSSPRRTPEAMEAQVLAVRRDHPTWGGRKIERVLKDQGVGDRPSVSTITEILRRHGLLDGPGAGEARDWVRFEHTAPNELWQMDFKGHVAMAEGRCHPLTVLDDHSRYSLEIGACADEQGVTVQARLRRLFERFGLPQLILADNGSPWGTTGSGEPHTWLTVWLLDLGVAISHGQPYHPQTQGKAERFHRTLKAEVMNGRTFANLEQAQRAFDAWREIYNTKRPHEGIGMAVPASRYTPSQRSMPEVIVPPEYEPQVQVRTVHKGGWLTFNGRNFNCSKAFAGRLVALRPTETDGLFDVCYRTHCLTQIDLRQTN